MLEERDEDENRFEIYVLDNPDGTFGVERSGVVVLNGLKTCKQAYDEAQRLDWSLLISHYVSPFHYTLQ